MKQNFNIEIDSLKNIISHDNARIDLFAGDSNELNHSHLPYLQKLSDSEQKRAQKFVRSIDSQTYIYAHYFLRKELSLKLDIPPKNVSIVSNYMKKPKLNDYNLDFNISHSQNFFAILIADSSNLYVGIDIEFMDKNINIDDIITHHMHLDEISYITDTPEPSIKKERFLEIWTRKEAFLKMTGIGITNHLPSINVAEGKRAISINTPNIVDSEIKCAYIYTIKNKEFIISCSLSEPRTPILNTLN